MKAVVRTLIILSPICACISAKADYTPNFSSGQFPKGVTVANEGAVPDTKFYQHGWTDAGWAVERFGTRGYVVVAPTHTGSDAAVAARSVMTLPARDVTEGMWLKWNARSLLADYPEAYSVAIREEGGTEFATLFSTNDAPAAWTSHGIDLADYVGKKCEVAFICSSTDKYLLMVDGISLFTPSKTDWWCENETPQFGDSSGVSIHGTVTNMGPSVEIAAFVLYDGDGTEIDRLPVETTLATSGSAEFSFDGHPDIDRRVSYSVGIERTDGKIDKPKALSGSYYCSDFLRRHVVDKGTGIWCGNCPEGTLGLNRLMAEFGAGVIPVETHINDVLSNTAYAERLGFHSVPSFRIDRNKSFNYSFDEMKQFYDVPTRFDISFLGVDLSDPETVALRVMVNASEPFDNSSDRYRVGYVITADFQSEDPGYSQSNTVSSISGEEFYFLPRVIPASMMRYRHVSLTGDGAFDGLPASLPASIAPMAGDEFSWNVSRPELLDDFRRATAVAYVVDSETGVIMNAASVSLSEDFQTTGAGFIPTGASGTVSVSYAAGSARVSLPGPADFTLSAYGIDGAVCARVSGSAPAASAIVPLALPAGVYMLRIESPSGSASAVIAVK